MSRRQVILFWAVAALAALVTLSGSLYCIAAVTVPLRINLFGRPFPAWLLGAFTAFWGGRMLYRLIRLPREQGSR